MSYGDKSLATLRSLVTVIERELVATPPSDALRAAWSEMVETLGLGPAPELRDCTVCGKSGMRAASRCMHCWSSLAPLAEIDRASARDA